MQRTHVLTGLAASVGTLTIAAALGFAQPDGLQPPAGSVVDTQPSLSSINDRLDSIEAALGNAPGQNVQVLYLEATTPDALNSIAITNGPTRVLSVSGYLANAIVFDGPGSFPGGAINPPTSGEPIGRLSWQERIVQDTGAGKSAVYRSDSTNEIGVIAENGLHIAYQITGWLIIRYEELS